MKRNFHAPFWSSGRRRDPPLDCNGTRPLSEEAVELTGSYHTFPAVGPNPKSGNGLVRKLIVKRRGTGMSTSRQGGVSEELKTGCEA